MTETMYHAAIIEGRRDSRRWPRLPRGRYLARSLHGLRLAAGRLAGVWDDPMSDRFNQEREREQQMLRRRSGRY